MAETTTAQTDRDKALTKAYSTATTQLRDKHRDEFNDLYSKAAADLGVEWRPRPNPEQKAKEQIEELLTQFPHLRDEFSQGTVPEPTDA
jgi:hypothetical protein